MMYKSQLKKKWPLRLTHHSWKLPLSLSLPLSLIVIVQATLVVLTGEGEFSVVMILLRRGRSALPPHIIVIIFIRLENRQVLFCVTILTRVTTHVNVFK